MSVYLLTFVTEIDPKIDYEGCVIQIFDHYGFRISKFLMKCRVCKENKICIMCYSKNGTDNLPTIDMPICKECSFRLKSKETYGGVVYSIINNIFSKQV
jgi:hypothetical protein